MVGRFFGVAAAVSLAACNASHAAPTHRSAERGLDAAFRLVSARARELAPAEETAPAGMIELPPAFYMLGATFGNGDTEERPLHEVVLAGFWLDRTEVTVDRYRACVAAGDCPEPNVGAFCNGSLPDRDKHPINCIDWHAAHAYCTWQSGRLPTEAEWEYAASGGSEKRKFAWGEEEPDTRRACYFHAGSCPVGSFAPGAFGLSDMSGNVWEWTSSWFAPYPEEAAEGHVRVYRGGSWSRRFPKWLRNTLRNRFAPEQWSASLGVRCARTKLPLSCPAEAEARGDRCQRMRGTPACERGFAWGGRACVLDVPGRVHPAAASQLEVAADTRPAGPHAPAASAVARATPYDADEPITRSRDPQFDADCQTNYIGQPLAHRISGGTFQDREPVFRASGCSKRDVGRSFTSICCGQ